MKPENKATGIGYYALIFGLFLGLAILKFGNPVILDQKIAPPVSLAEFWVDAWPPHWSNWILLPLALVGAAFAFTSKRHWPGSRWLWLLPLLWFGWQVLSATQTVDGNLTTMALCQFAGCLACYFIGALIFGHQCAWRWLLVGVLMAFAFCVVRSIDQRLFEFPQSRQMLLEGQRTGWTNVSPEVLAELKQNQIVITTNGADTANPIVLAKLATGRVMGTLIYPNALAGLILLLLPVSLVLAFNNTRPLRPPVRIPVIVLTIVLGGIAFCWTGSKLGWLIAMIIGALYLLRLNWPSKFKIVAVAAMVILGLGVFAARFHNYFASGATSASARFDYWRAAAIITGNHPLLGTGPGTFQRPYALLKSPAAEMARLAHNDYWEQFTDSGIPGGIFYGSWIILSLVTIGRRIWKAGDSVTFAFFIGLLGWFIQGIGEFSLYVPALAWTAFTLLGFLTSKAGNQIDNQTVTGYSDSHT